MPLEEHRRHRPTSHGAGILAHEIYSQLSVYVCALGDNVERISIHRGILKTVEAH